MAIKVLFIDFFGTIAKEDEAAVLGVCRRITDTSPMTGSPAEVARFWWEVSRERYTSCFGPEFVPMRELELGALAETIQHFQSSLDAGEQLEPLFRQRLDPALFEDSRTFLSRLPLPCALVTNGDKAAIEKAVQLAQLAAPLIITSEEARSYKPRTELYALALEKLGVQPQEALAIGDSIGYDIAPAQALGIHTAWVNRGLKPYTGETPPDVQVANLSQLRTLMLQRAK